MLKPVLKNDTQIVLTYFLRHHLSISGMDGVIVGLSGGLDSAVVAKLALDALGPEKVLGVMMPEATTPPGNMAEAVELAKQWRIEARTIGIRPLVRNFKEKLAIDDPQALGNVKARIRATVLYHLARNEKRLVLGTSNKSELLTGYFTKYGDGAADLCPIGDLYKTQVIGLAAKIGIPEKFIERVPSGDLWEGQIDETELGIDYITLDRILLGIELGMVDEDIIRSAQVTEKQMALVRKLVKNSVHKRRLGLVAKLGARTVGLDWRESDII